MKATINNDEYFNSEREIKVKGELKLINKKQRQFLPSRNAYLVADDLAIAIHDDIIILNGTSASSLVYYDLVEELGFEYFSKPAGVYYYQLIPMDNTTEPLTIQFLNNYQETTTFNSSTIIHSQSGTDSQIQKVAFNIATQRFSTTYNNAKYRIVMQYGNLLWNETTNTTEDNVNYQISQSWQNNENIQNIKINGTSTETNYMNFNSNTSMTNGKYKLVLEMIKNTYDSYIEINTRNRNNQSLFNVFYLGENDDNKLEDIQYYENHVYGQNYYDMTEIEFIFHDNEQMDIEFNLKLVDITGLEEDFILGENIVAQTCNNLLPMQHETYVEPDVSYPLTYEYTNGLLEFSGLASEQQTEISTNIQLEPGDYTFSVGFLNYQWHDDYSIILCYNDEEKFVAKYNNDWINVNTLSQTTNINKIKIIWGESWGPIDPSINAKMTFMLNEGDVELPFESARPPYIDETKCQLLDFKIDEKSDIYCETMPFSEMSIEVENSQGYFSDFSGNSIVDRLNSDCYLTLYFNVNDTGWYWAWQMQYYGLTSNNEKATLTFRPYPMSVFNSVMLDENKNFANDLWVASGFYYGNRNDFKSYFKDNYDIIINNLSATSQSLAVNMSKKHIKNISNLLFYYGTILTYSNKAPYNLISLRNNNQISFWNILPDGENTSEIDYNFLLEKPLVTKETLDEVDINTKEVKSYSSSRVNYQNVISSTFVNDNDKIVLYEENYIFDGITTNDISIIGGTLNGIYQRTSAYNHYLILDISGVPGSAYTININADLYTTNVVENTQQIYRRADKLKASNKLEIDNNMTFDNSYWKILVADLERKVKFRIPALPGYEIGDIVRIVNNQFVVEECIITEIHTTWNNGFIMEITGYGLTEAYIN